jgi:hypothetical protein
VIVFGPPRPAVGIFRPLTHLVDPDAYAIELRGVRFHFARCGSVAVPYIGPFRSRRPWCRDCIEDRLRVD